MYTCNQCGYNTHVKCNYIRHLNNKKKCGQTTIESESGFVQSDNSCVKTNYVKVENNKWECLQCHKIISSRSKKTHFEKSCRKGLDILQCEFCFELCKNSDAKWRHKKTCKHNPVNLPQTPPSPPQQQPVQSITNNIGTLNNNNIQNYNNNSFNLVLNFGQENVGYLLSNVEHDPRISRVTKSVNDTIDLVHFNEDHPENQTVRKLNKKSDLMEIRTGDEWQAVTCTTGIPRLRHSLASTMQTRWFEDNAQITDPNLKEMLYYKSVRGPVPENSILERYSDENVLQRIKTKCADECAKILEDFLKTTIPKFTKMPCMVQDLTRRINEVRTKYEMPELSILEVCRSY